MSNPTLYIGIVELERTGPCSASEDLTKFEMPLSEFQALVAGTAPDATSAFDDAHRVFGILQEAIECNSLEEVMAELDNAIAGDSYARIDVCLEDGPYLYIGLDKLSVLENMISE